MPQPVFGEQEVTGGGHREELGDPFDQSEQEGGEPV
jgi:hypothetical protein